MFQSLNLESSRQNTERETPRETKFPKASTPCGGVFNNADRQLAVVQRVSKYQEARQKKELDKIEEELRIQKE